jgi:hypothetical protein
MEQLDSRLGERDLDRTVVPSPADLVAVDLGEHELVPGIEPLRGDADVFEIAASCACPFGS